MSEEIFDSSVLSHEEKGRFEDFEADIQKAKDQILGSVPEDIANLGTLLRECLATGDYSEFRRFLDERDLRFEKGHLEHLADLIIVQRFDLKDLEPAARTRLRHRTLLNEDPAMMTVDYKAAVDASGIPSCRDCHWFINGPDDMGDHDNKSCVALGTKGADQACFGFTRKISEKPSV